MTDLPTLCAGCIYRDTIMRAGRDLYCPVREAHVPRAARGEAVQCLDYEDDDPALELGPAGSGGQE